jgi:hypothetical protein
MLIINYLLDYIQNTMPFNFVISDSYAGYFVNFPMNENPRRQPELFLLTALGAGAQIEPHEI